ncbi:CLUMA_CG003984, isoform A [Clunio marinus]|uniref:CLUMA_CG003984, isoform A n=1 Tax=Clunio marinus TaxID=568069 RepID=A0A1J1HVV0_9DIPT|nr:CLUMA_CG003984, isoform A [Clunio marinus]
MDFDKILEEIGDFGRYQKIKYYLLCLPVFFAAANSLSYVFTVGHQHYRCLIPECESAETAHYDTNWLPHALPGEIQLDGTYKIDHCNRFKPIVNGSKYFGETCSVLMFSKETIKCNQWVFDKSSYTIAEAWNIVCEENKWKLALVGTAHFAGVIVGSLWMAFGDHLGRKITLILATFFMSLTGIGQALSTSYEMFVTFAFLNAVGLSGIYPLAFIMGLEMVGKTKRGVAGIICNYFYSIGVALLGVMAYFYTNYIVLQLLISIPPMILFIYYWIIPESVRWLLAKNKNKRAIKIIEKAAEVNGTKISEETLKNFRELEVAEENSSANKRIDESKSEIFPALREMLTTPVMVLRILILLYNFAVNALIYFGLSLNSVSLSGNKYFNFVLVSLVEIPGYYVGLLAIEKFGRVPTFSGAMFICGITCALCGYADVLWLQIALFLIGKLGITCSFSVTYIHSSEMMPTVIRSSCIGFFATMSRVGSLASPFAPFLEIYYKPLPYLVFGFLAFVGGILYLYLPETLNRKLPNTVEEAMRIRFQADLNGETPLNEKVTKPE